MRLIVERWYIGPIVGVILLYICWMGGLLNSQSRVADSARQKLDRIYSLASQGKFDQILAERLATEESVKYLRLQEVCLGRVVTWQTGYTGTGTMDQTWSGTITVQRSLGQFTDVAAGPNPHEIHIALDPSQQDLSGQTLGDLYQHSWDYDRSSGSSIYPQYRGLITNEQQALDAARPIIHQLDAQEHIQPPLTVWKAGDFWVIEEHVSVDPSLKDSGSRETRYLVLWKGGDAIERVRGGDSARP